VTCGNGHTFCSSCLHPEMHAPAPCNVVKRWLKKCRDDSETANWLSANTQDCPKCQSTIEKNGGCNHMTCRKCKHEFCWVCMEPWQDHKDYYSCNRYEASTEKQKEGAKAASRAALDRYLFYYHRFMNHEQSRKLERCTRLAAEQKMEALLTRKVSDGKRAQWTDGQFIGTATDELMACRLVLKWTYVLAHHLKDNSRPKNLFCDLQTQLESHTERLSGLIESDVEQLIKPEVRQEVLSLTGVAKDNRKKLLNGIKGILLDGSNLIEAHDDDDDDDDDDEEAEEEKEEEPADKESKKRKVAFGVVILSTELASFFEGANLPHGEMGRAEVVKHLWAYFKAHNLQNPKNKRQIIPDEALARVFGPKGFDAFKSLPKLVSKHVFHTTVNGQSQLTSTADEKRKAKKPKAANTKKPGGGGGGGGGAPPPPPPPRRR